MKNKILNFVICVLMCSCFLFAGCTTNVEFVAPSSDLTDITNNADSILKTKNNNTIYSDENGNSNNGNGINCFADAYLFVDPGYEAQFYDHFSKTDKSFADLVDREIDVLAKQIVNNLNLFYGDGTIKNSQFEGIDIQQDNFYQQSDEDEYSSLEYDFNNLYSLYQIATLDVDLTTTDSQYNKVVYIIPPHDDEEEISIVDKFLNFKSAMFGGYNLKDNANGVKTFDDNLNSAYGWMFQPSLKADNSYNLDTLIDPIKFYIANAILNNEEPVYNASTYNNDYMILIQQINYLGFTDKTQSNIINFILNQIIGEANISFDDGLKENLGNVVSNVQSNEVFANGGNERFYKAYGEVVPAIVKQSLSSFISFGSDENLETEQIFIMFPRTQIVVIPTDELLTMPVYDEEGNIVLDEDVTYSEYTYELSEKLSEYVMLQGVLFLPRTVTGERTRAIKENGEFKMTKDGEVELETFDVEGFICSSLEMELISETEENVKLNIAITVQSDNLKNDSDELIAYEGVGNIEFGNVKPTQEQLENRSTDDINSYELCEMSAQSLIEEGEDVIGKYRLKGYNGCIIENTQVTMDDNKVSEVTPFDFGEYTGYTLSTDMYKYISLKTLNDVVSVDLTNFAGTNYVLVWFEYFEPNTPTNINILDFNIEYI